MRARVRTWWGRTARIALGLLVVGLVVAVGGTEAQGSPGGTVDVGPQKIAPGGTLTLSGWCARVLLPDGTTGPPAATTAVLLDTRELATVPVNQTTGNWGPITAAVPQGTPAGDHTIRTGCGGAGSFTVIATPAAPTLSVTPNRSQLPVTVTVSGTCAPGTASAQLLLDGYPQWRLDVNQATGEIQAIRADFGTGTPIGDHRFTTSCGGVATFTAVAAPAPTQATTTPAPSSPAPGSPTPAQGTASPSRSAPASEPDHTVLWVVVGAAAALGLAGLVWALLLVRRRRPRRPGGGGRPPEGPPSAPAPPPETLVGGRGGP